MSVAELKKHIADGNFQPIYLFLGEENYFKRHYLNLIKEKLLNGFEDFDLTVFEGKKLTVTELQDALNALPIAAEKRITVIKDLPLNKSNEVCELIKKDGGSETNVLIVYQQDDSFLKKSDEAKEFCKASGALMCEFVTVKGVEQTDWVVRYFAKNKKTISRENAEYFLSICPEGQDAVKNECDKLIARCEKAEIKPFDIDEMVTRSLDSKGWQLTEAVITGKTNEAYILLQEFYDMKFDESVIAGFIYKAIVNLTEVKMGMLSNKTAAYLAQAGLGNKKEFVVKKQMNLVKNLPLSYFSECISLCLECDIDVKSKSINKKTRIETLIAKIAAKRAQKR